MKFLAMLQPVPQNAVASAAAAASFVAARLGASPSAIAAEVAAAVHEMPKWVCSEAAEAPVQLVESDSVGAWWAQDVVKPLDEAEEAAGAPEKVEEVPEVEEQTAEKFTERIVEVPVVVTEQGMAEQHRARAPRVLRPTLSEASTAASFSGGLQCGDGADGNAIHGLSVEIVSHNAVIAKPTEEVASLQPEPVAQVKDQKKMDEILAEESDATESEELADSNVFVARTELTELLVGVDIDKGVATAALDRISDADVLELRSLSDVLEVNRLVLKFLEYAKDAAG